ncbi:multiheme c-type cytochrome [Parafilimonas sp.]|uniref:multiheme c-type cytochrome n=1 Tax=Parafilimonas sp. TaxID=1969739 RepID=UPI0039E236E9
MFHFKKSMIVCSIFIALFFFIKCSDDQAVSKDPRGIQFAGSAACMSCHKDVMNAYMHNSHFNASAQADYNHLSSMVNTANNTTSFINGQKVVLNSHDTGLYQTYYRQNQLIQSAKTDIAFGAAVKAQTYAYWKGSQLYQLPLTYLTNEKIWTNSPGFPIDHPYFNRVIPSRCLECHASFVQVKEEREKGLLQIKQVYNPASIVYGIDCERCHGPAAQHVKFQQENPGIKEAKFIISIKSLSRQQQVDMCGTCHSGDPVEVQSIFNFMPGDPLSKYYMLYNGGASGEPDVHGMQLQLLQMSKCYQKSKMTCMTCHSPHQSQETTQAMINQCISCHQQVTHTIDIKATGNNCITCHMPLRPSKSLDFNNETETNKIQYMLRTHRIAVYAGNAWK